MAYNNAISSLMDRVVDSLNKLQYLANKYSMCNKVHVGAMLCDKEKLFSEVYAFGYNTTLPVDCRKEGCRRIALYGEDSKNHRNPADCRAIHAEVSAMMAFTRLMTYSRNQNCNIDPSRIAMVVTRYPCEACARMIADSGLVKVLYYGGEQEISDETKAILHDIPVFHVNWVNKADTTR